MKMTRLRYMAEINPATPAFDRVASGELVTFTSLDAIWPGGKADLSRAQVKESVGSSYVRYQEGDVLLPKVTPTFQAARAAVATGLVGGVGVGSTELHILRARAGHDARFICYVTQSLPFLSRGVAAFQGVAGLQRVPGEYVASFPVPAHGLDSQRRIAEFLDDQVRLLNELIDLKMREKMLVSERGERELSAVWLATPPVSRRRPDDLPQRSELHRGWSIRPLSRMLRRITYGFTNPMPLSDDGPYLLTAADVGSGSINWEGARRTMPTAFAQLLTEKSRPEKGDVLLTKDGSLGRVVEMPDVRACVNQSVAVLKPMDDYRDGSIAEVLSVREYRDALVFNAGGGTIKHLYITRVAKQQVAMPDTSIRADVVRRSRETREHHATLVTILDSSVDLLNERKQALITAAVTGQFDVTTARKVSTT